MRIFASIARVGLAVLLLLVGACDGGNTAPVAIPAPSMEGVEAPVAAAIHARIETLGGNESSADAWGRLGTVLDAHGFTDEAVVCYRQAGLLDPSDARWPYLAASVRAAHDPAAAIAGFERAIAADPAKALYLQTHADALVQIGRDDEAREQYARAIELDPKWRRAYLGLAELAIRRGDFAEALARLQEADSLDHCDREVHAKLARVHRRLDDEPASTREALLMDAYPELGSIRDAARAMVDAEAVSTKARTRRGLGLVDAGRYADAEREFRFALEIRPDNVRNRLNLGGLLVRQGKLDEALVVFRESLAVAPEDPEVHNNFAVALTETGDLTQARSHLEQAIRLNPSHDEAYFNLGRLELRAGRVNEAAAAFEQALAINPVNVSAHNELGRILAGQGRLDEAMRHWQDAIDFGCNNPEASVNLAMTRAGRGQFGPAVEMLHASLRRHRDHEAVVAALATILATCPDGRFRNGSEAVRLAQQLVARNGPEHFPSLNLLAAAQAEAGDFRAAVTTAGRALAAAQRMGDPAQDELARSRLVLYQSGRPYHQGAARRRR